MLAFIVPFTKHCDTFSLIFEEKKNSYVAFVLAGAHEGKRPLNRKNIKKILLLSLKIPMLRGYTSTHFLLKHFKI